MQKRNGKSGLGIAPLVLGGNVFGWTADKATSFAVLDAFLDAGFNAVDTADVYSRWVPGHQGGESESVLGAWMKERGGRNRIVLITKGGQEMPAGKGLTAANLQRACEDSLKRLQTDHIDLYFSHFLIEHADRNAGGAPGLIDQGKVRGSGSNLMRRG
jgi:aryl-alcohol dehydrogenase-like predicted oxidoreductase